MALRVRKKTTSYFFASPQSDTRKEIMPLSQKILIVDDARINVLILKKLLQDKYIIETAESGEKALHIIPEFRPDLILLDIMMPGIDGYEVCRRVRKEPQYRFTKIILVSAKSLVDDRLQGYEAGADDYITKPFDKKELEAKVQVFSQLKHEEELNQLKGDLLLLFSHETKTPLSVIIGLSEILQKSYDLDDDLKGHLETISTKAYQLLEFINKTSLICSLKSGVEPSKSFGSVTTHLKGATMVLKDTASQKKVAFELDIINDIELYADWAIFDKALGFVLENAVKFSPEGATVTVETGLSNGRCVIRIIDQGEGIKKDWIDNIFDEFAVQNIMHHQKGQGLSLAISRYIMELHNGTIGVESTLGNGATFILSLPVPQE